MSLLNELKALQIRVACGTHIKDEGICGQILICPKDHEDLRKIFTRWPEYSGNASYPITMRGASPRTIYVLHSVNSWSMWNKAERYGMLRHELLNFCIDYLEKQEGYHVTT